MSIFKIIQTIADTRSSNAKIELVEKNSTDLLKRVFFMTYSPTILYGVRQYSSLSTRYPSLVLEEALNSIEEFICTRKLTGNAAVEHIETLSSKLSEEDSEVLRRIINRDLECGFGPTQANKIWKGLISKQPQCLASPNNEKTIKNIKYPAFSQIKEDGARCFAEYKDGEIVLKSRSGKEYYGLSTLSCSLTTALIEYTKNKQEKDFMIDGELVVFKDNIRLDRSTSNGIINKASQGTITELEQEDVHFMVWDIVPLSVYDGAKSDPYNKRLASLETFVSLTKEKVKLVDYKLVNSEEEAKKDFSEKLALGLEGTILKNTDFIWEDKRSKHQVKFKLVETIDLEIVDIYVHSKDEAKLGGMTLKTSCGRVLVNCGSGFTDTNEKTVDEVRVEIPLDERDDHNRAKLWSIKDSLIGKIVEVECNGPVKSKGRDTYSLFLPIFKGFRDDKTEANTLDEVFSWIINT